MIPTVSRREALATLGAAAACVASGQLSAPARADELPIEWGKYFEPFGRRWTVDVEIQASGDGELLSNLNCTVDRPLFGQPPNVFLFSSGIQKDANGPWFGTLNIDAERLHKFVFTDGSRATPYGSFPFSDCTFVPLRKSPFVRMFFNR